MKKIIRVIYSFIAVAAFLAAVGCFSVAINENIFFLIIPGAAFLFLSFAIVKFLEVLK